MPTLSELLTAAPAPATPGGPIARGAAPQPPAAPARAPAMPVRLPGGDFLRPGGAPAVPPPHGARPGPQAPAQRTLGRYGIPGAPAPPGGIPRPRAAPPIPGAPRPPAPKPGADPSATPAPKVLTLTPNVFADTWTHKPKMPIQVGLRLIADGDLDRAREYAANRASSVKDDDARIEAYNEVLMQWVVARATCKPEDARQPFWQAAQDTVAMALTDDGLRLLFHEVQNLKVEQSPLQPEAREADLMALSDLLGTASAREIVLTLGEPRLRRHIAWILDEVRRTVGPGHVPAPRADDEADPLDFPTGPVVGG